MVLYEPEIPQNTGNIARTCAAVNARLHLIEPLGFSTEDRYLKRAGLDYWHLVDVTVHASFNAFLSDFGDIPCWCTSAREGAVYTSVEIPASCSIIFGCESRGLPRDMLDAFRDRCIRIPLREGARSLNLSNAAAVVLFEIYRRHGFPGLQ